MRTVFRSDRLEISVDGNNKFSAPNMGTNKHIDLTDRLFIGGMELKKKTRAIRQASKLNVHIILTKSPDFSRSYKLNRNLLSFSNYHINDVSESEDI